jgi:hypothetical protein
VGDLKPLFFSPVRMLPVDKERLKEDIKNEIEKTI